MYNLLLWQVKERMSEMTLDWWSEVIRTTETLDEAEGPTEALVSWREGEWHQRVRGGE